MKRALECRNIYGASTHRSPRSRDSIVTFIVFPPPPLKEKGRNTSRETRVTDNRKTHLVRKEGSASSEKPERAEPSFKSQRQVLLLPSEHPTYGLRKVTKHGLPNHPAVTVA